VAPYIRTVKTASGARAVQIVHSSRRGARDIEHIGSAHDDVELELLKTVARQRLAAGQGELDLGLDPAPEAGGPLPITSARMGHLWDALACAYDRLGFDGAAGGDEVFRHLVLARIIEPTSKLDSLRVLEEAGIQPASYRTVKRRLPVYAAEGWRQALAAACARQAGLGPASLVLYDVSTLYFETDAGDGFREPGFSKERRLEPQITIGLLTDAAGFPLMVNAFEGNRAETKTMLPSIRAFMAAHRLPGVTIVADAGMISEANMKEIEAEDCRSSSARRSRTFPTSSNGGAPPTRTSPSPTGTSSPSPGPPGQRAADVTRSFTTNTGPTGPAAPCAASTSRSPRRRKQWRARWPSSATDSSGSPAAPAPSTGPWRPRPVP
jgi:hypothetical protein